MGRHVLLAAALAALLSLLPATAHAGVRIAVAGGPKAAQTFQRWADRTPMPTPRRTITLKLATCPNAPTWAGGCAIPDRRVVYLRPHAAGPHAFFHEIGHVYDATVLGDADRRAFQRVVGLRGAWAGAPETDPPIEQFAEAYSLCARTPKINDRAFALYAYTVSPAQHARVCALIARAQTH